MNQNGNRTKKMSRGVARKNALYLVFQLSFHPLDEYLDIEKLFFSNNNIEDEDTIFISKLFYGVVLNIKEIDEHISKLSIGWTIDRISKVELAILRLAYFELVYLKQEPAIVINEAVKFAKTFSDDNSHKFVNGILGKVVSDMIGLKDAETSED